MKKKTAHLDELLAFIPSSDGVLLEARLHKPHPLSPYHDICVIITHPYGRLGGDLNNNVVESCFEFFAGLGFMTARFNFRGVGKSTGRGTFRGFGELEDVMSVYKYIKERDNLRPRCFILCGYSYGSVAACAVYKDMPECVGVISISYPAGVLWALTLGNSNYFLEGLKTVPSTVKKLFIYGTADNFSSPSTYNSFVEKVAEPKKVHILNNFDHFWFDREHNLTQIINVWLKTEQVIPPRPKAVPLTAIEDLANERKQQKNTSNKLTVDIASISASVSVSGSSSTAASTSIDQPTTPSRSPQHPTSPTKTPSSPKTTTSTSTTATTPTTTTTTTSPSTSPTKNPPTLPSRSTHHKKHTLSQSLDSLTTVAPASPDPKHHPIRCKTSLDSLHEKKSTPKTVSSATTSTPGSLSLSTSSSSSSQSQSQSQSQSTSSSTASLVWAKKREVYVAERAALLSSPLSSTRKMNEKSLS